MSMMMALCLVMLHHMLRKFRDATQVHIMLEKRMIPGYVEALLKYVVNLELMIRNSCHEVRGVMNACRMMPSSFRMMMVHILGSGRSREETTYYNIGAPSRSNRLLRRIWSLDRNARCSAVAAYTAKGLADAALAASSSCQSSARAASPRHNA